MPFFGTGIHFSPTGNFLEGQENPMFNSSLGELAPPLISQKPILTSDTTIGFYFVSLTVLTFVYLVGSIRTNFCLFSALLLLVITFGLFAGSYFSLGAEQLHLAAKLQLVSIRHISDIIHVNPS